jgi:hypothetical protein
VRNVVDSESFRQPVVRSGAEFEEFAVDVRCTPRGVLPAHLADQRSDFGRNDGSSGLAAAYLPGPEQTKPGTMPGNDLA